VRFRIFLASYLAWRVAVDFLKPQPLLGGMNVIQWTCLGALAVLALLWAKDKRFRGEAGYGRAHA
jgi:hypothetical protein